MNEGNLRSRSAGVTRNGNGELALNGVEQEVPVAVRDNKSISVRAKKGFCDHFCTPQFRELLGVAVRRQLCITLNVSA
jgi:hypothetical protein